MRLSATLYEDVRGHRWTRVDLYLHGAVPWPEEPRAQWVDDHPGRSVGHHVTSPAARSSPVSNLDVLAPDDQSEEGIVAALRELREDLCASPNEWAQRGPVAAYFHDYFPVSSATQRENTYDELVRAATARLQLRYAWTQLRVSRLDLADFRGIDQLTLSLSSNQTTVLVGTNGAGKTTLLQAAVLLLSRLESQILGTARVSREFTDADVMNGSQASTITIDADLGDKSVTWSLSHERGGEARDAKKQAELSSFELEGSRIRLAHTHGDVRLPLAVFYPVNRAVLDIPLRIRTSHTFEPMDAYDGALAGSRSNFRLFFEWFRQREDLENEERIHRSEHRDHQLEAVRRAIHSLVPEFSDLRVRRSPLGMVVNKGERMLYVDQLSDGEKCLLAMVGDLARRLAMANPLADDPLQGGGVVLID